MIHLMCYKRQGNLATIELTSSTVGWFVARELGFGLGLGLGASVIFTSSQSVTVQGHTGPAKNRWRAARAGRYQQTIQVSNLNPHPYHSQLPSVPLYLCTSPVKVIYEWLFSQAVRVQLTRDRSRPLVPYLSPFLQFYRPSDRHKLRSITLKSRTWHSPETHKHTR